MNEEKKLPDPNDINRMIDEVIAYYVAGDFKRGVEGVKELAEIWKAAGEPVQTFREICEYMENEAVDKTGEPLIRIQIRGELLTQTEDKIILH